MPTVSVIIPTWNACKKVTRCLDALLAQTQPAEQILIVDNASTDGTADFIAVHYPTVTVVALEENRASAGGLNTGSRLANCDYIASLDSDAYPTLTWLEALVGALERHQEYAFAASRLLRADAPGCIDSAGQDFDFRYGVVVVGSGEPDGSSFDISREVFAASHAGAIYRREVFERVGELDESLFMYGGDMDFGFRARLQGYRCLYVADAIAYHEGSATLGRNSPTQIRFIYRNGITIYMKNMPWPLMRATWPHTLRLLIGMLHHAPHHSAALRGVLEALWRLPATLYKRRQIQRARIVNLKQLWAVMTVKDKSLVGI